MNVVGPTLSALLKRAGVRPVALTGADPAIAGASIDSRQIGPGDVFFAIRGFKIDGERFVGDALRRGAAAVVARSPRPDWVPPETAWVQVDHERHVAAVLSRECFGRPDERLDLVGVTGTNGKTTATFLIESIARAGGRRVGRLGTVGYALGATAEGGPAGGGTVEAAARTTPEAPELFRMLRRMADDRVEVVAMEVSSHALALCRVDGARFRVAAFLNLSRDHLDFHESERAYLDAKLKLLRGLDGDAVAVVPHSFPAAIDAARESGAEVRTFGRAESADVRLTGAHGSLDGSSAVLETASGRIPVRTHLIGDFNLDNVCAAAACALALGLPADAVTSGVAALESIPGRMERIVCGQSFEVLVDYAHTPEALQNLLGTLRPLTGGRLHLVFGCGGSRDRGKRPEMGAVAARGADALYPTSDNPRAEDPRAILDEVLAGVATVPGAAERTEVRVDRRQAIESALQAAEAADVVVVAGKGHETTQTVGDRVLPFDDRAVCREVLLHLDGPGRAHA